MNESSARAERFQPGAGAAPAFTWAVPLKPVAVRIPLDVMEKLEREAVESYRSLSSRGSEIGGLLFGAVTPGSPAVVEVRGYEPVPCEYASGPLYRLNEGELARLDEAVARRGRDGMAPVGFFRSHTRRGLSLDAADLAVLDARFGAPHQIALLIRPSASKPSTGGIFIREEGVVRGESSYLEFPMRGSADAANHAGTVDGEVAGPRTVAPVPAAPGAARPAVRAQIVPIASRREVLPAGPPALEAEIPEPLAPAPEPRPSAPLAGAPADSPMKSEAVPAAETEASAAAPPATAPAKPEPPPAAPAEPEMGSRPGEPGVTAPRFGQPEPQPQRKAAHWFWMAIGAAALAVLAGAFFLTSGVLNPRRPAVPAPAASISGLALRVERNAGDILLTWNREADAIRTATRAVLTISDGPQQENVDMDLSQLRTGSIVYSPVTGDVVFRMQVSAAGRTEPVSESVRVLRTRPSPMPEPGAATPVQAAVPPPAAGMQGQPTPEAAPGVEPKVALAQPVKTFHPESLAQRLRPSRPADIPDLPMVAAAPAIARDVTLSGIVSTPMAPPPAAKVEPEHHTTPSGGQVQQAELVHQVSPQYPPLARQAGAGGDVELLATIGTDGRVRDVTVVRGNPLLRDAAIAAVKQWIFRPTTLNGKAIESQTKVTLTFKRDR